MAANCIVWSDSWQLSYVFVRHPVGAFVSCLCLLLISETAGTVVGI